MRLPVSKLAEKYQENVFRAAFSVSRNPDDAEDVVQDTFLKYMESGRQFESEEHIKAWLLRTAMNRSKDLVHSFWHRNRGSFEEYMDSVSFEEPCDRELVETVLSLPEKYRIPIYLFYYEDYSVKEIAGILKLPESTAKSRLYRGRKMLKDILKEDWTDDE